MDATDAAVLESNPCMSPLRATLKLGSEIILVILVQKQTYLLKPIFV